MKIEKANLKLDSGEILLFKDPEDGKFIGIGGAGKDYEGDFRDSDWFNSIEEVLQHIGAGYGYTQNELKENLKTWKYIKSIPWALSDLIPKGTRVLILPNAEEECEKWGRLWNKDKQEMIGKVYEAGIIIGCFYEIKGHAFPRQAFTIAIEEEESLGVFKDMDKTIAKFNDALVDMGLEVKKIKE